MTNVSPSPSTPLRSSVSMPRSAPQHPLRGVFRVPWLGPFGQGYLVAVDRNGRRRARASIYRDQDEQAAADFLWAELNQIDPDPVLRLVG